MQAAGEMNRREFVAAASASVALPTRSLVARAEAWPAIQALLDSYVADKMFAGVATAAAVEGGRPALRYRTAFLKAVDDDLQHRRAA